MALRIYNSATRRAEEFSPLHGGEVRMYVCGPNLYAPSHVGHAFSYLVFDMVRRYLEYRGFRVNHVQNFTDIEDRIIETARERGTTIQALAREYADRFLREMAALNVRPAGHYPRATEMIPQMIEIIQALVARGFAYVVDGDVFYRVSAFPAYGRLSGRSLDEMQAGSRIEVDPRKEHPMDFVLWKAAKAGEPAWDSPWGRGRPGWHIECSAMSLTLLGQQLDIHGGGQDVIFPHHENEIAQSEAFTGRAPFVRYWVHNGLLRLPEDAEKMTRHLGNIVTIQEALQRYHPDAIRVFAFSAHYRSPATWTDSALEAASRGAERLRTAVEHARSIVGEAGRSKGGPARGRAGTTDGGSSAAPQARDAAQWVTAARETFEAAMDDDFNTPRALAAIFDLATEVNRTADAVAKAGAGAIQRAAELDRGADMLQTLAGVLGLTLSASLTPAQRAGLRRLALDLAGAHPELFDGDDPVLQALRNTSADDAVRGEDVVQFIGEGRMRARRRKDWATGDAIRSQLQDLGVLLEDSATGFTWRLR